MAMVWSKLNSPYDAIDLGIAPDGRRLKMCFFVLTFDATSVSGVTGTTYDSTNHYTTTIPLSDVAGSNLYHLWGIRDVSRMVFSNGSSDAQITGAAANSNTGECKAEFVQSGRYIRLKVVGTGVDATNGYTVTEAEVTTAAGNMSSLRFSGYLIGS